MLYYKIFSLLHPFVSVCQYDFCSPVDFVFLDAVGGLASHYKILQPDLRF